MYWIQSTTIANLTILLLINTIYTSQNFIMKLKKKINVFFLNMLNATDAQTSDLGYDSVVWTYMIQVLKLWHGKDIHDSVVICLICMTCATWLASCLRKSIPIKMWSWQVLVHTLWDSKS
jgi:hypothetical protein